MTDRQSPYVLPSDLPVPIDDGACLHLPHSALPRVSLRSTAGPEVILSRLATPTILFFYPRTGIPGQPPGPGFNGEDWDSIPGARGCTPQSCGFRDLYSQFKALGLGIYGVSTNTTDHQREFKDRNHIPFDLLSDSALQLTRSMNLPTFEFPLESGGPNTLVQRMAWYIEPDSLGVPRIVKVWHPVFPPDKNAEVVLAWLKQRARISIRPAGDRDRDFVKGELCKHWLSTTIWSIDRSFQADGLPAFVASLEGTPVGLVTYSIEGRSCEIVTLSTADEGRGVGARLLDAAVEEARRAGCTRAFLTTTNDNLHALAFYQRRGWRLVAVHRGMIDRYRDRYEKRIPLVSTNGVPIHDEIELELILGDDRTAATLASSNTGAMP